MLTNKTIDAAKPKDKPYKLADAYGLYIWIAPTGLKSWRCNYKLNNKHNTHTFGKYPGISIAEARQLNNQFKLNLEKNTVKTPSFGEVAKSWLLHSLPKLKNIKHQKQVINRLDYYVLPSLSGKPINDLKRAELVAVLQEVQAKGVIETAHRVATYIRQILDYAVDMGLIEAHPANGLSRVLQAPKEKHQNCIAVSEAPALLKAINSYPDPITRLALLFVATTFVRSTELRLMQWDEIQDKSFWVIPGERMKMGKPHVVPLTDYALKLLDQLKVFNGESDYVFNSAVRMNKPICENTMLFALYRLGYRGRMTVHGFRALASTILNQESPFSADVIERQLAHKETDAIRAAYHRAEYLEERIKLMQWWTNQVNAFLG